MQSQESTKPNWVNSPIIWLLAGIIFTLLTLLGTLLFLNQRLAQYEPDSAEVSNLPTIIRLTAPATPIPSATPIIPTPTTIPTLTPSPTPNRLVAQDEITIGFFAQVANTDGFGANFRNGVGLSNELLLVLEEETAALVIEGPVEFDGFIWWRLELEDGMQGWIVSQFLVPASEPSTWRTP